MAWISVDQKLLGGKLRDLHKEIGCSRNEAIGILIGLWLWGMDNAYADGLLRGCDKDDILEILAIGANKDYPPETILDALLTCGWLEKGEKGFYIHDWEEWRYYYNKSIADKEKNKERQRRFRERHSSTPEEEDNSNSNVTDNETVTETKEPAIAPAKRKDEDRYTEEGFKEFWDIYPRKEDKGQAYRKYVARRRSGITPEEMITAAKRYAEQCKKKHTEKQYIKKAHTFIGDAMPFLDYINTAEEQPQPKQAGENPFL